MDLELCLDRQLWAQIFRPIQEFAVSSLYQQHISLENSFATKQHFSQDIILTLVRNTLLLSDQNASQIVPFAAVQLTFDLKFEVLYAQDKNVKSQKIGLRLFYQQKGNFYFYSNRVQVLEAWTQCLSKQLNQQGFHQMFKPLKKLGKGNFATVYEVQRFTDGRKFAVKAFSKQGCFSSKNGKQSLMNQLSIMRSLSNGCNSNVLKLQSVFQSDNSIYVVLELLTGGQLFHKIQNRNGYFSEGQVKQLMLGLLNGLKQMHNRRIMHRDIKPENIMIRSSGSLSPVIVDFGLATFADIDEYLFFRCGTPGYVAPEIIELSTCKQHIEPQCDIFSIGVIFHILLTRKPIFEGTKYNQVYKKNKEMNIVLQGQKYDNINPEAIELLKEMLKADPVQRITAEQAINHPYFNEKGRAIGSPTPTNASAKKGFFSY